MRDDAVALIPPPPCNSYALVIATVGVGTVLIWYLILIRYKCSAAKAARGVWGMARVFDGKLYFTRDHMQGNFIPKNLKLPEPKPAPKPRAKASSKASSSPGGAAGPGPCMRPPPALPPPPPRVLKDSGAGSATNKCP